MRLLKSITLMLTVVMLAPSFAIAESPAGKTDLWPNAALQYWQAFALMPNFDKDEEKIIDEWKTVPLNEAAMKLINSSYGSIQFLNRAAKMSRCDWGLDYDDGISLILVHLNKARNLAKLAALHARYHFEQGHWVVGREIATSLMVMARHVSRDPVMIGQLVRYMIEGEVIDLVAPYVPQLKADPAKIAALYESMPKAVTLTQVVLNEKQHMTSSIIKQLKEIDQRKNGNWRELWDKMLDGPNTPDALKRFETLDQLVKQLEALGPVYDELASLLTLPKEQFDAQYPAFKEKTKAAHPLATILLPAMDKVVAKERRHQARMAMLMAGIAVAQGGPDKLKDTKDPFGTGPFEYRGLDKGFELKSKLQVDGQPVTLVVGQGKKN